MARSAFSEMMRSLFLLACASFGAVACVTDLVPDAGPLGTDAGQGRGADAGRLSDGGVRDAGAPVPLPPVMCGAQLPGPQPADVTEFEPGYAAAAGALDLLSVPPPYVIAESAGLRAPLVNYMLQRAGGTIITQQDIDAAGPAGAAVQAAYVAGGGELDFTFLRRGFHHTYYCSRPVPASLEDFVARYGDYTTWPIVDVPCGAPKDSPRRLYARDDGLVFVAETRIGDVVRETEALLLDLRTDGQLDFAAYTAGGELTDRSAFATASSDIVLAAPYTCLSCHIDQAAGTFSVLAPTGTGAGCND